MYRDSQDGGVCDDVGRWCCRCVDIIIHCNGSRNEIRRGSNNRGSRSRSYNNGFMRDGNNRKEGRPNRINEVRLQHIRYLDDTKIKERDTTRRDE